MVAERKLNPNPEDISRTLSFPHGEIAKKAFEKAFPNDPKNTEQLHEIIEAFFQQEMANTAIFKDKQGASLPFTKINVTDLARAITNLPKPESAAPLEGIKHKRIFILPSSILLHNGHQFTFVELALKQAIKSLPAVVENLLAGETPPDIEIFTLGSPTNQKWGQITPQYLEMLRQSAYETLGNTYASFAEENLPQNPGECARTTLIFFGQSQSASMAAASAESLISQNIATQNIATQDAPKNKEGLPYVQVVMDTPVTLNRSRLRKTNLRVGFFLDAVYSGVTSSHIRRAALGEAQFLDQIAPILKSRGIETHETKEEISLKKQALKAVMEAMYKEKVTIDAAKLKVNIRRGIYDLTIPPLRFAIKAMKKQHSFGKEKAAGIGKYLVQDKQLDVINNDRSGKVREAAIRGTHIFSIIFPKHEMKKWKHSIERIRKAKEPKSPLV